MYYVDTLVHVHYMSIVNNSVGGIFKAYEVGNGFEKTCVHLRLLYKYTGKDCYVMPSSIIELSILRVFLLIHQLVFVFLLSFCVDLQPKKY